MAATSFVALYRGETVSAARLVAVSADPALVTTVSDQLLRAPCGDDRDPALENLERGRRAALRLIRKEISDASGG